MGVQALEAVAAAGHQAHELSAGELVQRWHLLEVGVDLIAKLIGDERQRGAQAADAPRRSQPSDAAAEALLGERHPPPRP